MDDQNIKVADPAAAQVYDAQLKDAMAAADVGVGDMGFEYRVMRTFREISGLPLTDASWTDDHEKGAHTLFASYALANQYISERMAGQRSVGTDASGDVAVLGDTDEVSVRAKRSSTGSFGVSIVQCSGSVSGSQQAFAQSSAGAGCNVVASVSQDGFVGLIGFIVAIVATVGAVAAIIAVADTMKKKIAATQEKDLQDLPILYQQAGYTPDEAAALARDRWTQAHILAAAQGQGKSPGDISEIVTMIVWGAVIIATVGGAVYVGAPWLRQMLTERKTHMRLAA